MEESGNIRAKPLLMGKKMADAQWSATIVDREIISNKS